MKSVVFINFRRLCRLISQVKPRPTATGRMGFCTEFIIAEGGKSSSPFGVFRLTPYRRRCRFRATVKSRLHHASVLCLPAARTLYFRINILPRARARSIEISRNPADITPDPTGPTASRPHVIDSSFCRMDRRMDTYPERWKASFSSRVPLLVVDVRACKTRIVKRE